MRRAILAIALLLACSGAVVIGDSLSAAKDGWCQYNNERGRHYKCLTQSMRFAATYAAPPDLAPVDGHRTLFYWLMTNDAVFWDNKRARDDIKAQFKKQMAVFLKAGFRVVVILPPSVECRDTSGPRLFLKEWAAVARVHFGYPVSVIDPDRHSYAGNTRDCLHPTREFSEYWGDYIDRYRMGLLANLP